MHPNALKNIKDHIEIALQGCLVKDRWPIFESYTDTVSSLSREVIKHKKQWLTVPNCYSIFLDYLHSYLKTKFTQIEDATGKLTELIDRDEILELETSILDFITSIPRTYEIYFPLPSFKDPEIINIQLSDSLFIKKFNEGDSPLVIVNRLRGIPTGFKELEAGTTYVVIKASGYARSSIDDMAFRESLSSLKQLLHMCLVLNLIKLQEPQVSLSDFIGGALYSRTIEATIIDLANQNEIFGSITLPLPIASHIHKIILNTSSKKFTDAKQHGEGGIGNLFKSHLNETSNLIKTNHSNAQSVKSAIEWAFDSQVEENETISFIQLSIGLEAILGEETGREPLTETLADRCAYLLANTIENRKIIRNNFREFYSLRSKLVHGRSMRLKDEEKGFLEWGKHVLNGTILKEIKNLKLLEE